jgi:hypothetical protein
VGLAVNSHKFLLVNDLAVNNHNMLGGGRLWWWGGRWKGNLGERGWEYVGESVGERG